MTPSWTDVIATQIQRAILEMHTAMPGVVNSYSPTTQTAEIKPLLRWQKFLPTRGLRELVDLPPLPDVLVCHPRGGDFGLHLPLVKGDLVLLVMCSRELTQWRSGGATDAASPGTVQPMPLAGAIALPLMTHDSLAWGGGLVAGGTINVGQDGGTYDFIAKRGATRDAIDQLRQDVDALVTVYNTHTHSVPALGTSLAPAVSASSPAAVAEIGNQHVKVS